MRNIHSIYKWKCSWFCLAFIDQTESTDDCQIQINKFFKLWIHEELTPLPPFGNLTDVEMDNQVVVIDKDYDFVFNMVRECDVFIIIISENNLKKVHYYLLWCTMSKCMLIQEYNYPSNYTYAIDSMVLMGRLFE